jgi:hypothetical protein
MCRSDTASNRLNYCSSHSTKPAPPEPDINVFVPTSPPEVTHVMPTAPADETSLEIRNLSSEHICYVYIVPAGSETWGDDLLGNDITIPPNEGKIFPLETNMYFVKAENCDHEIMGQLDNSHIQGHKWWDVK